MSGAVPTPEVQAPLAKLPCTSPATSLKSSQPSFSMKTSPSLARFLSLLILFAPLTACVTQRTVTRNGQPVEQGLVVKRPLKEAVENSR